MKFAVDLTTLPTRQQIACYCYTAQTNAFLAAFLLFKAMMQNQFCTAQME